MSASGYSRRQVALDGLALALVAVLPLAIFYLAPTEVQAALAFDYDTPALWAVYTAALVHHGPAHLWGNVGTYLLVVLPAWALHLATGRRRRFWMATAGLLLASPVLATAGTFAWLAGVGGLADVAARGFSGVVAGLAGYLLLSIVYYVMTIDDGQVVRTMTAGVLIVVVGCGVLVNVDGVATLAGADRGAESPTGLLATGAGAIYLGARSRAAAVRRVGTWARSHPLEMAAVATGLVAFAVFFLGAFPRSLGGGPTVNVLGHGVGVTVGVLLAALLHHDNVGERPGRT